MRPGMMPILHLPGEMMPGQFGPMSRDLRSFRNAAAFTMSRVGMPSVMATMSGIPASAASMMASAANGGGTKMTVALAPVFSIASATVLKTGQPSCVVPPLPGVTPPTTLVPYSAEPLAWKVPSRPVRPCTIRRVFLSTRTDILVYLAQVPSTWYSVPRKSKASHQGHEVPRSSSCSLKQHSHELLPCRCDDLFGGVFHVLADDEVQTRLLQDLSALL